MGRERAVRRADLALRPLVLFAAVRALGVGSRIPSGGPSWVSWQQSGDDFGWAPLAPEVVINAGYAPPIESWHYCGAAHVLDVNITRYYEPRERVVEIHRSARPMQNYATVSNVKVIVGPSSATLRTYHVEQPRVKIDVKIAGRVSTTTEAHAQVVRAQTNQPQREAQNQKRIQANTHIAAVVAKLPARVEPKQSVKEEPKRVEPVKEQPKKPAAGAGSARRADACRGAREGAAEEAGAGTGAARRADACRGAREGAAEEAGAGAGAARRADARRGAGEGAAEEAGAGAGAACRADAHGAAPEGAAEEAGARARAARGADEEARGGEAALVGDSPAPTRSTGYSEPVSSSWILVAIAAAGCAGSSIAVRSQPVAEPTPVATPAVIALPAVAPAISAVHPWIGVSLAAGTRGVRIKQAIDHTPGARAGLQPDDEILAIDGVAMHEPHDVMATVGAKGVGTRVTLHVLRAGRELDVPLALEARPDDVEILHRKLLDKPAPGFALAEAIGPHAASTAQLAGDVVVVEFGATWCGFCMSTVPRLEEWQTKYRDAGLRVVWISSEPLDTIRALDPSGALHFTRARDADDKLALQYFVQALPTLIVIDRDGVVRAAEMGAGDTVDAIEAVALEALAHKPAAKP